MIRATMVSGAMVVAGVAQAQDRPAAEPPPPTAQDDIVVTGTRATGRAALASSAPIDVVSAEAIESTGYPDLSRSLNFLEPSVNFARAATTASAANTRSITLRGLSPDQTLVLVDGKRRHANAVLNVNNSIGRGSAGVDLDTIPDAAIERVEVLRDGASAQYGSDAIAGVVNVILKAGAHGGSAELLGGVTEAGDGLNGLADVNLGLPLGAGHLNLTAAVRHQDPTNRAFVDQRFGRVTYRIGDPFATVASGAIDVAVPVSAVEVYGFGTIARKISNNGAGFRVPGFSPVYPMGFLPIIQPRIWDGDGTIGLRGTVGRLRYDLSEGFGYNRADFGVFDTANVSLGATSPTRFDAGSVTYRQAVTDATVSTPLDGVLAGGNAALGAQYRNEHYAIRSGEPAAYLGTGADGFAGFNPRNPTDAGRDAYAGFLDVEVRPIHPILLGGAVRYDHYGDFGGATTWRVTGRWDVIAGLALRGTIGTGFKAPSLQQQYYSAVQGALSGGALVNVATLPVSDPIARAVGAVPLKPERSNNVTAGIVVGPIDGFSFTADYYNIRIADRIALSEQLGGAAVAAVLRGAGITGFSQVRFFTNAVDTRSRGLELTARWQYRVAADTRVNIALGYSWLSNRLVTLRANPVLPTLPLLATKSILFLTRAQPDAKGTLAVALSHRQLDLGLNFTAFGTYTSAPLAATQTFGGKESLDLSAGYRLGRGFRVTVGVQNVFDAKPDTIADQASFIASTGGSFPTGEETPLGLNGRSYYLRLAKSF